ncbi:MAG: class I SAM-dependent methyltransferase [Promethearchaeota archaeon]
MNNSYFISIESCPACNSTNNNEIYSCEFLKSPIKEYLESFYNPQGRIEFQYLEDAEYILMECKDCELIYQKQIPNDFLMKKLYEEWIDPELSRKRKEIGDNPKHASNLAREIMMMISYFNRKPKELNFLDFGFGWGAWCLMAKAFGCNSFGTELSDMKIKHAKSLDIKIINWDEIPNHKFDFINTERVFEHIPKPLETLIYLKKSLKPNGLIKISVPNCRDIKRRLKKMNWKAPKRSKDSLNAVSPLEHINCYTEKSVRMMAVLAGFEIVNIPLYDRIPYVKDIRFLKPLLMYFLKFLKIFEGNKGIYVFLKQEL